MYSYLYRYIYTYIFQLLISYNDNCFIPNKMRNIKYLKQCNCECGRGKWDCKCKRKSGIVKVEQLKDI